MPIESDNPVVVPAQSSRTYPYIGFNSITISWPDPNGDARVDSIYRMFGPNPDTGLLEWAASGDGSLAIEGLFAQAATNPVIAGAMQLIFFELEGRIKNLSNRVTTDLAESIQTMLAALEAAKATS